MSLTIELSQEAEQRLREEAARRNSSVELLAAQLLNDQLRFPIPAEFDVSEAESQFFVDAVHKSRSDGARR
jgi:predicted transcriptional regulator